MRQLQLSSTLTRDLLATMQTLGPLIRTTRERRGIRAVDLAYRVGKDPSWLSKIERDLLKEVPEPEQMAALSAELGIPVVALLRARGYDIPAEELSTVPDHRLHEIVTTWSRMTPDLQKALSDTFRALIAIPGQLDRDEEPPVVAVAR